MNINETEKQEISTNFAQYLVLLIQRHALEIGVSLPDGAYSQMEKSFVNGKYRDIECFLAHNVFIHQVTHNE